MIGTVSCLLFLMLASAALAQTALSQTVIPETLASAVLPISGISAASTFAAASSSSSDASGPITGHERLQWAIGNTIGQAGLASGLFSAGWDTLFNVPKVYGTHGQGFGARFGMRLTSRAVSNAMEAGLGKLWGEDPRYTGDPGAPFRSRVAHAVKMTFMAQNREGGVMPAYARLIALPGSSFLSNSWRADSDATLTRASIGTGLKFLGRLGSNTFKEFRPDVQQKLSRWRRLTPLWSSGN